MTCVSKPSHFHKKEI